MQLIESRATPGARVRSRNQCSSHNNRACLRERVVYLLRVHYAPAPRVAIDWCASDLSRSLHISGLSREQGRNIGRLKLAQR